MDEPTHAAAQDACLRLKLYVTGDSPSSVAALHNLQRVCEQFLAGRHELEIVDLMKCPHLASQDGILTIPTLVCRAGDKSRKIMGNLGNPEELMRQLGLAGQL